MFGNQTLLCQVVLPVRSCAAALRHEFPTTYSALMPAALMIGIHLSISDLRWARNASGCALSEGIVSAPAAASRLFTSGSKAIGDSAIIPIGSKSLIGS